MAVQNLAAGVSAQGAPAPTLARALAYAFLLSGVALLAAWRIVAIAAADSLAAQEPASALRWRPDHPQALLDLAEQQIAKGRLDEAQASARSLLAIEPLDGRGFTILAKIEALRGRRHAASVLYGIAARRAPRDLRAHDWLTVYFLATGRPDEALGHIDTILRVAPWQAGTVLPWLSRLTGDPAIAGALARRMQSHPQWRTLLLSTLDRQTDLRARDAVLSALLRAGDLTGAEAGEWIAQLLQQGRWTKAYSIWASRLEPQPAWLPMVFNGDFATSLTGSGFEWRRPTMAGVSTEVVPARDGRGFVAHAQFQGRAASQVNLVQPLLLAPGRYRFSARVRARALLGDSGLEWSLTCHGQTEPIALSERLAGSFGWRTVGMELTVPERCLGQWLSLRNPAPSGLNQKISGEIWFDDVTLQLRDTLPFPESGAGALPGATRFVTEPPAVLRVERGRAMISRDNGFAKVQAITHVSAGDRVLVLVGTIAKLDYGKGCIRSLTSLDVHVVAGACPASSSGEDDATAAVAARMLEGLEVGQSILGDWGPRPPVPAGR